MKPGADIFKESHGSDQLAFVAFALVHSPDPALKKRLMAALDKLIAKLGPVHGINAIRKAIAAHPGTELEPFVLNQRSRGMTARFVQLAFSKQFNQKKVRIVSEDTIGIEGGLVLSRNLKCNYLERFGGNCKSEGLEHEWYFTGCPRFRPRSLPGPLGVDVRVNCKSDDQAGYVISVRCSNKKALGWVAPARQGRTRVAGRLSSQADLIPELMRNSSIGRKQQNFESFGLRLARSEQRGGDLVISPGSAEALVRLTAQLTSGGKLILDPGDAFPKRAQIRVELSLPKKRSSILNTEIRRCGALFKNVLWADLDRITEIRAADVRQLMAFVLGRNADEAAGRKKHET